MGRHCAAYGCSNSDEKNKKLSLGLTFHHFPINRSTSLKAWEYAVKRKNFKPTYASHLCSDHFKEDDFQYQPFTGQRRLKPEAVPSNFTFTPVSLTRKKTTHEMGASASVPENPGPSHLEGLMYPKVVKVELDQSDEDHSPGVDFNCVKDECRLQPLQLQLVHLVQPDPQHSSLRDRLNDNSGIHLRSPVASPSTTQQPTACLLSTQNLGKRKQGPNIEDEVLSLVKDYLFKLKPIPATREVEDQHDVFGKNIAHRLRSLPRGQRIHVEKLFSDVLYEAELSHLNRSSVLVTAPDLDD